jgi:ribonucleoside-triphosphate reductase
MFVKKRNNRLVEFDKTKIYNAIIKAMQNEGIVKPKLAENVCDEIEDDFINSAYDVVDISEIEDKIFDKLISKKQRLVAKSYEGYRRVREFQRNHSNTTDSQIAELLNGTSDYWNKENSNKNAKLVTVQRDYMAGIVSTDITRRYLLPPDIVQAHDEGIIHFHKQNCGIMQ